MPRTTIVITLFLASPNDVELERELVVRCVAEWNQINGYQRNLEFEIIRWESSIAAGFGTDGQEVINRQVDDQYDLLIALLWTRLGTETPRAVSGTAEEYERALARYKNGEKVEIAFYFKDSAIDPRKVDLIQLQLVHDFECSVQKAGALTKRFASPDALRFEVNLLLDRVARKYDGASDNQGGYRSVSHAVAIREPDKSSGDIIIAEEADEPGLFDIAENLERHAAAATEVLSDIAERLGRMTSILNEVTAELGDIARLRTIQPSEAKPLIHRVAEGMNDYSAFLESALPGFSENSMAMMSDIRGLIDVSYDFVSSNPEAMSTLVPFRNILIQMTEAMESSLDQSNGLLSTLINLQRTTSDFNRAKRRLTGDINNLITNMDSICAIGRHAIAELDALILTVEVSGQIVGGGQ